MEIDPDAACPACGQQPHRRKLTDNGVREIRRLHDEEGKGKRPLARQYRATLQTISHVIKREMRVADIDRVIPC
jgi:hypothetical protein